MKCLRPVDQLRTVNGSEFYGERRCGYCEACKLTYRQSWACRIILESYCHEASSFVTLTYDEVNLPSPPQLYPNHLQLFIKRLRRRVEPFKFRFFAAGEYGARSLRPHYHLVIFGLAASTELEELIQKCWSFGFIKVDPLTPARASYVAKYVCKEVSNDDKIPEGYQREFARMSLRPYGIGGAYIERIGYRVNAENSKLPLPVTERVGGSIRIGPVYYPFPRYFRDKIKEFIKDGYISDTATAIRTQLRTSREILSGPRAHQSCDNKEARKARASARARINRSRGVL